MPKANEHIVVIGGTSGIGLSLARPAHALGCKLTIGGRGAKRVSEIATSMPLRSVKYSASRWSWLRAAITRTKHRRESSSGSNSADFDV
jgi:NAD(P)-dependent dehydrogenase (short-subunit alcohol dehydrogenase family)